MPHYGKQLVVADYGRRFHTPVLIETGTYTGHMVMAMLDRFETIFSIELDPTLAGRAQKMFSRHPSIHIVQGASEQCLPDILAQIHQPCLLWLDAHYSSGQTTKSDSETPILHELDHVLKHPLSSQFVLLIDDARCFTGASDYPTLEALSERIHRVHPDWNVEVRDDIIRAHVPVKSVSAK
jgi:hypothetical protein